MMKTTLNIDLKTIIIIVGIIVLLFGGGFGFLTNKLNKMSDKLTEQQLINRALNDTVSKYMNKYDEIVSEKSTIQADLKEVLKRNNQLNENQKELLRRIEDLSYKNEVISAALISTETKIDKILNKKPEIDTTNKTIKFRDTTSKYINYGIKVNHVLPSSKTVEPSLLIDSLRIPNKQFIDFHWDEDADYDQPPISFTISNSNPYIETINIESYTIPEINKNAIKPEGWEKVKHFINKNENTFIVGGACAVLGLVIGGLAF